MDTIEIVTYGLDEVKILNSTTNNIEISLFDENLNEHTITTTEEFGVFKITFELDFVENSEVFRKFITKRLNRASAVIKIPKNKSITIHGKHIDIISESFQGNIAIYIDKGLIKLNTVKENINIKLFQGNVFATVKNTNIDLTSNKGTIKINEIIYPKKYQKKEKTLPTEFKIHSINANITLQNNTEI